MSVRKNVGFKQELDAQDEVGKIERELEAARERLANLRKGRYNK